MIIHTLTVSIVPFALVANLFYELEDGIGGGATDVVDAAASAGRAALLDAQNEEAAYGPTAGTDLPEGRYIAFFRLRDTNQVASDVQILLRNNVSTALRNEENDILLFTVTAAYAYYGVVFDITAADVAATNAFLFRVLKATAGANDVYADCLLIVPIGDGESFPQDLAHAAMRSKTQSRRIFER